MPVATLCAGLAGQHLRRPAIGPVYVHCSLQAVVRDDEPCWLAEVRISRSAARDGAGELDNRSVAVPREGPRNEYQHAEYAFAVLACLIRAEAGDTPGD